MHDMNFFSYQKRRNSKNNGFRIFLLIFIIVTVLLNAALFLGGRYIFGRIQESIDQKKAYIENEETKDKIKEAEIVDQEVKLVGDYYLLMINASQSIDQMKQINSRLLDEIRQLTPLEVTFQNLTVTERQITIECSSENEQAVIDMYHAFLESKLFANVRVDSIDIDKVTHRSSFEIAFAVKGE